MYKFIIESNNREIEERIYNTNDKNKAIDLFRREFASGIYKVKEIVELKEMEEQIQYNFMIKERIKTTMSEIEKSIKKIIKNPFANKYNANRKVIKINYNISDKMKIEKFINDLKNDNIEIYIRLNEIQICASEKYINELM